MCLGENKGLEKVDGGEVVSSGGNSEFQDGVSVAQVQNNLHEGRDEQMVVQ